MTRIVDLKRNLSLLTDFYELTMSNGYFLNGMRDRVAVFDMFFRTVPDNGGFAIFAGLEQLVEYLENLSFSEEDIEYLREQGQFSDAFLEYLANFEFACDIWAPKEGTPIFPGEPVVVVKGPLIQTQLVETMVLLTINHQSLIATKTNRMIRAAGGRAIFEFGSRRAQGYDAAVLGARASYIGGCAATACVLAGRRYGIPVVGTMAHSWVQSFDSEYEAFKSYAELYPDSCTLLVDTYNVIKSGVPNAIRVFNEVLLPKGFRPKGIRIDSGDIAYLSKRARAMLDEAGFADVKITASKSLDEDLIRDLILQGAKVDLFGVGENLITSKSAPVFGGVYKLAAVQEQEGGEFIPKIKVSESVEKITTPGFKRLYRLYDKENGKALADYITLYDETVDDSKPLAIFDQHAPWKKQTLENYVSRPLLEPIFSKGKLVYTLPSLDEVKAYCTEQVNTLWDEVTRFENPHTYYVDLSQKLWDMKYNLLEEISL